MCEGDIQHIQLSKIKPFDNWHTEIKDGFIVDNLQTKAHKSSIKFIKKRILEGGTILPILVMKMGNGIYQRLDGFCRYWAYKELGKDKIPCTIGTKEGGQGELNPFLDDNKPRYVGKNE